MLTPRGSGHKGGPHPGMRCADLGPNYHEHQASTRRQIVCHVGRLSAPGFEVTLCRLHEPAQDNPATAPAA
jgi:hypothetical protein